MAIPERLNVHSPPSPNQLWLSRVVRNDNPRTASLSLDNRDTETLTHDAPAAPAVEERRARGKPRGPKQGAQQGPKQGNAPRALCRLDKRGVPLLSLGVSALITALCVAVNYLVPKDALTLLMSLVVSALVINWAMISLAHLKFRRAMQQQQRTTTFRALWYPFGNYACVAFVAFILILMFISSGFEPYQLMLSGEFAKGFAKLLASLSLSVWVTPIWLAFMWFCYKMKPVQA